MTESALSPIAAAWLERRGFTVYAELPVQYWIVDLVGRRERDGRISAIEIKPSLGPQVALQARRSLSFAHEAWCAVGTRPAKRGAGWKLCRAHGLGVLSITDGRALIALPAKTNEPYDSLDTRNHPKGGTGGLTTKAASPRQRVIAAVVDYLEAEGGLANHRQSWREIFDAVPNHYAHWRSMRGALAWALHLARGKRLSELERAEIMRLTGVEDTEIDDEARASAEYRE